MSKFLAMTGMVAFLASPALGQFTIDPSLSTIKVGFSTGGFGGATFAVDSSPLSGTFSISQPDNSSYEDPTDSTVLTGITASNTATMTWFYAPFIAVDLTTLPGEFEMLGFGAPDASFPLSFFSNSTIGLNPGGTGSMGGSPVAFGGLLTEVLARLAANGSAVGGPVTLDTTSWIPTLDGSSFPTPFILALGGDGTLGSLGGGPDEASFSNSFWIDAGGGIFLNFTVSVVGDGLIPEPATMTLLGLGGLALVRRVRRRRSY